VAIIDKIMEFYENNEKWTNVKGTKKNKKNKQTKKQKTNKNK
jgi:hypothetical protein